VVLRSFGRPAVFPPSSRIPASQRRRPFLRTKPCLISARSGRGDGMERCPLPWQARRPARGLDETDTKSGNASQPLVACPHGLARFAEARGLMPTDTRGPPYRSVRRQTSSPGPGPQAM